MAMVRLFVALVASLACAEAANLRGDSDNINIDITQEVSQADIDKATAEAVAGDHLAASDIRVGEDEDEERQSAKEGEEHESEQHEEKHESRAAQLKALQEQKKTAIANEDYDKAKELKGEIDALNAAKDEENTEEKSKQKHESGEAQLEALMAQKKAALANEDYDEAKKIKAEMDALKSSSEESDEDTSKGSDDDNNKEDNQEKDDKEEQEEKEKVKEEKQEKRAKQEAKLESLKAQKKTAVENEDYKEAKSLKAKIDALTEEEQEEEPVVVEQHSEPKQQKHHSHMAVQSSVHKLTAEDAEKMALAKSKDDQMDDEEAKEMADFDAKHPDVNDQKEAEFQKQVQAVYDSTTETEEDAELEMKAEDMKKQRKLSNGGEFESVDEVKEKMIREQKDAEARKKELAGFDDFFSGSGTDAGKADHSAAALDALIPKKSSAGASGMGDMGAMMSMFGSLMGGSGGMGDLMGGMGKLGGTAADKLSQHAEVEPQEDEAEPQQDHHVDASSQKLLKSISSIATGGNMDMNSLVNLVKGITPAGANNEKHAVAEVKVAAVKHAAAPEPKAVVLKKVVVAKAVVAPRKAAQKVVQKVAKAVVHKAAPAQKVVQKIAENVVQKVVQKAAPAQKVVHKITKKVDNKVLSQASRSIAKICAHKCAKQQSRSTCLHECVHKSVVTRAQASRQPGTQAAPVQKVVQKVTQPVLARKPTQTALVATVKSGDADAASDKDVEDAEKAAENIDAEVNTEMGTA